ncbi:MAG: GTP-binding protein HflX [Candidatus Saganbacteria bacterium]|uniref:GTPase HflX n=1 Tax=Candidatus Saganbacteria bacterium TaxID=2575572 RepID=A0A833L0E5_UNCSA|nr:MAG: GTP-binding protein HflX [Candidatus Saganbacteria bacterium]
MGQDEKAILVGVKIKGERTSLDESLEELKKLAITAGAQTVAILTQNKDTPDRKYFIGEGKLEELKSLCDETKANLIIFDHDISPSQIRNLEDDLNIKVINRTELILDIFAQHAHSREGKLQVELAQSEFLLSKLSGYGISLSRLGGGIGTRGPGETKLESDRRRARKNISQLKKELEKVSKNRKLLRENRRKSNIATGALIGYTNSGKSTLLNSLAKTNVLTEDKLFATLDPVTKRVYLPNGKVFLLTDTVGFIQNLPYQLVDAFHATLEEAIEADFLIHVVDSSSEYLESQISAVYEVLEGLKIITKPMLTVFNKIDIKMPSKDLLGKYSPSAAISAYKKEGFSDLTTSLEKQLSQLT